MPSSLGDIKLDARDLAKSVNVTVIVSHVRRLKFGLWLMRIGASIARCNLKIRDETEWQHENLPPDCEWCWVTDEESVWLAMRDRQAASGWTNTDTWEDFDGRVTRWIPIDKPDIT